MPQLSLYVDTATLAKIEKAAKLSNTSISRWVSTTLAESLAKKWPENYVSLFGSIKDETFVHGRIEDYSLDAKREEL